MVNNQELSPLRSRYSLYSKTGHTRWDVTASWKVLLDTLPDGTVGYDQFEDLRKILAMFVAAPSSKSRTRISGKLNAEQDPGFLAGDRMAFAMRQLRVDTLSDIVDGLQATLTLSLFNYKPYSAEPIRRFSRRTRTSPPGNSRTRAPSLYVGANMPSCPSPRRIPPPAWDCPRSIPTGLCRTG